MKANVLILMFIVTIIPIFCSPAWGTDVAGIIDADTTWDLKGSPYTLTGNVQIAEDATLKIEPGVRVKCAEEEFHAIQLWGTLEAVGTGTSKILFDVVQVQPKSPSAFINVQFAEINGGSFIGEHDLGGLVLRDSKLYNSGSNFGPEKSVWGYLIERNVFFHKNSTRVVANKGSLYKHNVFRNIFIAIESPDSVFEYNSISGGRIGLIAGADIKYNFFTLDPEWLSINPYYFMVVWNGDASAAYNYWGTTDTAEIESVIYDRNDDLNIKGYISYLPILENKPPTTPPVAYFRADPTVGQPPLEVKFTDQSILGIVLWEWDFGGGSKSTEQNPSYTYTDLGKYKVSLTVTDILGLNDKYEKVITLRDKMPLPPFLLLLDE